MNLEDRVSSLEKRVGFWRSFGSIGWVLVLFVAIVGFDKSEIEIHDELVAKKIRLVDSVGNDMVVLKTTDGRGGVFVYAGNEYPMVSLSSHNEGGIVMATDKNNKGGAFLFGDKAHGSSVSVLDNRGNLRTQLGYSKSLNYVGLLIFDSNEEYIDSYP